MCAPITVATGGASGGCTGMCQVTPWIIGSMGILGILVWNFRGWMGRHLGFTKASA